VIRLTDRVCGGSEREVRHSRGPCRNPPLSSTRTTLVLTFDPDTATLVNHGATISETPALGTLVVDGGSVVVDATLFADGFESGDTSPWSH